MPAGEEAAERSLLHGLDLAAQGRKRRTPQPPQDVGIAPLALAAAGAELATDELLLALESAELLLDVDPEPRRHLSGGERPAPARPPGDERAKGTRHGLEEHRREPRRGHDPERVAIPARILRCREPLLARDADADRAPLGFEDRRVRLVELAAREVSSQTQQIVEPFRILRERT